MKIECATTFLHGRDRFEAGDVRTVPDADGEYFVSCGWAAPVGEPVVLPADGVTDLDIHNAVNGLGDSNG